MTFHLQKIVFLLGFFVVNTSNAANSSCSVNRDFLSQTRVIDVLQSVALDAHVNPALRFQSMLAILENRIELTPQLKNAFLEILRSSHESPQDRLKVLKFLISDESIKKNVMDLLFQLASKRTAKMKWFSVAQSIDGIDGRERRQQALNMEDSVRLNAAELFKQNSSTTDTERVQELCQILSHTTINPEIRSQAIATLCQTPQ